MRRLDGELLLTAFEKAAAEHDLDRGLALLAVALPERSREQLAALPLAERNLLLLRLRELSFGSVLKGFGTCSQCCAHLEFALPTALLIQKLEEQSRGNLTEWSEDDKRYELRAANSGDLLAVLALADVAEAQQTLLKRCLSIDRKPCGAALSAIMPGLLERFEELNVSAELRCAIECPECSHSEVLDLDIARFLWLEVSSRAQCLLEQIHQLAWAYGWSERAIIRLGVQRRNAYMEMLST